MPAQTSDAVVVTRNAWNTLHANAFASNMDVSSTLLFPWEAGTIRAVFGNALLPPAPAVIGDSTDLTALLPGP